MASTVFVDKQTLVPAAWLNDVNKYVYNEDSPNVGFLQGGTGAIIRTVQNKLRESVSVLDFGAVADGNTSTGAGTDNSAAFQTAVTYAQANSLAVFVPAGAYVLLSQVTVSSNVRLFGAGMYRTFLIAKTAFIGNGLLWAAGAGGPPTIIEHMAILGQTSTGAGVGSTGIRASSNATILHHIWCGGFSTQFRLDGTDQHATDCWADVSLASGVGFAIENVGVHLLDCVTFNCYTGILIDHTGAGPAAEPDVGVTIIGCEIIQAGYSGISMISAINTSVSDTKLHSPATASKFTRDFVTITDGLNITLSNVMGTFGNAVSTTCVGIRQTGQTQGLKVIGCNIMGADYGYQITNTPFGIVSNNAARGCRTWGFRVLGDSAGLSMTGNQSSFNGTTNATDGGGYWLSNSSGSGKWNVTSNSAGDFGVTSKYGFYIDANADASTRIGLGLNAVTNTTTAYTIVGTPANVTQTANI